MAKTFVGNNIERGVNGIITPVNEETGKLKKMNRLLKKMKKPGMEDSISIKEIDLMDEALTIIDALLNKIDFLVIDKLIASARKFIRGIKAQIAAARLTAATGPGLPTVVFAEAKQYGQKFIDDGDETIDGMAIPAMVGAGMEISNSKGLVTENAALIKEVKAVKEKGVDPKQALLDSKWTKALREGTTVSFYLESEENKKYIII